MKAAHLPILPVMLVAAGCSPRAVTPPARAYTLDSPIAPTEGHADVQADLAYIGSVYGPELANGSSRLRYAATSNIVVEAEAGFLHVANRGSGGSRGALTGRSGVMVRPVEDSGLHASIGGGVGGGVSRAAGGWAALDLNAALAGTHRRLRPVVAADVGYATPVGPRDFVVMDPEGAETTLRLPPNAIVRATVGVEIGAETRAVLIGVSVAKFYTRRHSVVSPIPSEREDTVYVAIGLGVRLEL